LKLAIIKVCRVMKDFSASFFRTENNHESLAACSRNFDYGNDVKYIN